MEKFIITILIIILTLGASCSKNTNLEPIAGAKSDSVAKQADVKTPDILKQKNANPNDIFSVSRDGQIATLDFHANFSAYKRIAIVRNETGFYKNVPVVAELPSTAHQFEDTLPNAGAFYYWIRAYPISGALQSFGPVRVGPDEGNKGTYPNVEKTYPWQVARSYTNATIYWNFPMANYRKISIKRNSSPNTPNRKEVYATKEPVGRFSDTLPDPEADYWYWIDATLQDGHIITQGPVKADFPMN